MKEYEFLHGVVYPVGHTCTAIDSLLEAAAHGDMDVVRLLAERLRRENAQLRHNATSWENEALKSRIVVDNSPPTGLKRAAMAARARKER